MTQKLEHTEGETMQSRGPGMRLVSWSHTFEGAKAERERAADIEVIGLPPTSPVAFLLWQPLHSHSRFVVPAARRRRRRARRRAAAVGHLGCLGIAPAGTGVRSGNLFNSLMRRSKQRGSADQR
jgi:hypothetical protein